MTRPGSDEPTEGELAASDSHAAVLEDEDARRLLQRRTLTVVTVTQVLAGAGLAAGVTVGALLAQEMLGTESLAGAPSALFTSGSALAAFLIGRSAQHWGRRIGLGLGFVLGGIGAGGVVLAAITDDVVLLFIALFVYGAGTASNLQARYAGTDLAHPTERGRAVSVAMVSTTLGAVAGPTLVEPLGRLAAIWGIPPLAGPFLLAATAYAAAGGVLLALLRPDPLLVARRITPGAARVPEDGQASTIPRPGIGAYAGAAVMTTAQIAMVAIMTMTPVHMRAHHHGLGDVGVVIGIHIAAMYLPSPVTGFLVDKLGRVPMAIASGATLLLAGAVAAISPAESLALLILALTLLGLGWNFGLIAGTALVVDSTVPANRARTQGAIDVLIALAGAGGGAMSGVVMASAGYSVLSVSCGVIAVVLIPALARLRDRPTEPAARA